MIIDGKWDFNELISKIRGHEISICIGVDYLNEHYPVKYPTLDHSLDPVKIDEFISKIHIPDHVKAVEMLLKVTQYIDFEGLLDTFRIALGKIDLKDQWSSIIGSEKPKKDELPKYNPLYKSGFWITRVLLNKFPELQKNFCTVDYYNDIYYSGSRMETKTYVFFDDAMFSGAQMTESLLGILRNVYSMPSIKIKIIAAYTTQRALDKLYKNEMFEESFKSGQVEIVYGKIIPTLKDLYPSKTDIDLLRGVFSGVNNSPVYFQHKMPDEHSSFPMVYAGLIPELDQKRDEKLWEQYPERRVKQVVPIMHNCFGDIVGRSWFVGMFGNTFSPCPKPPYKP